MNTIKKFFMAVRFIGLGPTLQTLMHTRYRDRIERRFPAPSLSASQQSFSPEEITAAIPAPQGAVFHFKHGISLTVDFLTETIVRLTWEPGELPVPYAVVEDNWEDVLVRVSEEEDGWRVTSGELTVLVGRDGSLRYLKGKEMFRSEYPPSYQAPIWKQTAHLEPAAHLYGLGERSAFNLRGKRYGLWNTDPSGSYGKGDDPLYVCIPVYYCQQPGGGYLIFYENSFDGEVGFEDAAEVTFRGGALRYYLFAGRLPEALKGYTHLTGRAPLPPRWALGFHQSRWGYQSEADIREVAAGFKQHDLPWAAIHLDIDYMRGFRAFTVDRSRFPDLQGLIAELSDQQVKTVTILDPGVKWDRRYNVFTEGRQQGVFCRMPDGKLLRGQVWPGLVGFPDFTNPVARQWWGSYYHRLLDQGVAGIWHDMNEPVTFAASGENSLPRAARHDLDGRLGSHEEAHNLYALLMNRAGYEALRQLRPDHRPWLLTRSGWAGIQRYAWKWSGDVESSWEALGMTIGTLLSTAVSGIPYSGSDIGGFTGSPGAELFLRWFQMAAFTPFFRNHAAKGTARSEPWMFGEPTLSICREFLQLRRSLLPYLYTMAWEAAQTGAPLMRPLWWLDPDDHILWDVEDAFLLGDDLLVAPVVQEGATARQVYLPDGSWYHFWDGSVFQGGQHVQVPAPLDRIPVFVRGGSVLPMIQEGILQLHLYLPGEGERRDSYLYEDAGDGYGHSRVDRFAVAREQDEVILTWASEGDYPLPDRVEVQLYGADAARLWLNGGEVGISEPLIVSAPFNELRIATKDFR